MTQSDHTGGCFSPGRLSRNQLLLITTGFVPLLVLFFLNLWGRPHYQFFPLALAGAGFLAWSRCQTLPQPTDCGRPWIIALLLGASGLLLGTAGILWTPWLGSIAALLALVGVILWLGGATLLRACLPALLLILTIIPPPLGLDSDLTMHLRTLAVKCSSRLLDLFGVVQNTTGNIIELPGHRLLVEEACSGINSVLFMLATCLFYTLWKERGPLRILVCLVGTVGFVVMGNIFRITVGGWLLNKYQIDLLSGWPHETLGMVLVLIYLGLIISQDRSMSFLAFPVMAIGLKPAIAPIPPARGPAFIMAPKWGQVAGVAFALIGLAATTLGWMQQHRLGKIELSISSKSALRTGASFTLPDQLLEWQRLSGNAATVRKIETLGIASHLWQFQRGGVQVTLALDYPFRGFHDVSVCYKNSGWTIGRQEQRGSPGTPNLPVVEVEMEKDALEQGYLLHGMVDEKGNWLRSPSFNGVGLKGRFDQGLKNEPTTYRVQVLAARFARLSPAERKQVEELYEAARRLLWQQLAAQLKP
jgi:exosortase